MIRLTTRFLLAGLGTTPAFRTASLLVCLALTLAAQAQTLPEPSAPEQEQQTLLAETLHWEQTESQWAAQLQLSEQDLAQVRLSAEDLEAHILAMAGSVNTYRVLQEQKAALPQVTPIEGLSEAIADLRLRQFELIQLGRQWAAQGQPTPDGYAALQAQLRVTFDTGVQLQSTHAQLLNDTRELRQELQEELFWVPSNPPMNMQWFQQLPGLLWERTTTARPPIAWQPERDEWRPTLLSGSALALLSAGLLLWLRRRLEGIEDRFNRQLLTFHREQLTAQESVDQALTQSMPTDVAAESAPSPDEPTEPDNSTEAHPAEEDPAVSALPSPDAVPSPWLLPGLLSTMALRLAPVSLLLIAVGLLLPGTEDSGAISLGPVLMAFGFSLFVIKFLLRVLQHPDIGPMHFAWSATLQTSLYQFTARFTWVLLPTTIVVSLAQQQTTGLTQDRLTSVVLVLAGLAIAWLSRQLLRDAEPLHSKPIISWILHLALVLLPLGMVALTALGFVYTVLQLTYALLATFYILTVWVLAEVAAGRGLLLATETLRRQRAIDEAEHAVLMAAAGPDEKAGDSVKPLPQLDIDKVTQQSGRLARFMILLLLGGLLFWVWYDMVLALGNLELGALAMAGDLQQGLPFSLLDLVSAAAILGLTLFLAANLPGLLEMVVLSRLHLQQGSAYATTTLLNYVILGTGIILALSALGVSWDRLQWLVAALSVGLGFGLQEIFANFVSGLIILFERPIRIGDVVTLGNLSGRVRQIRIRATTITDFDRKDIIVPNKTFVTGQLINWSLTDTVTRVTLKIGVAYGSDLERTREILLAAAEGNERVLKDPKPQVLFLSFGDSALDHELRIHVKELGDRNPAIDEINRYVDREFAAAGIEIAFQQIDIRLRNSEGVERLVEQRPVQKS
ncbi:MAG: mechanosensitive ion channel [Natronospirillum sp.]|uniref:mechanosensitive ion channel domain-containing protein n=1 Tax=Natronospirillum sp. TaxID=2812955 RepID=UPI0025FA0547|nr:mechanosensitive ion channel domain-containing protein [Natronospirillum sp.]MCH8553155.1 mechanosensitive ion channel [Natronospirillum sp.]